MLEHLERLHRDEEGATATEYVCLLILVACFIILMVQTFGATVSYKYNRADLKVSEEVRF